MIFLVTKFDLVMPAPEALLRDVDSVKQSLINTHYQVELGNEPKYDKKQLIGSNDS